MCSHRILLHNINLNHSFFLDFRQHANKIDGLTLKYFNLNFTRKSSNETFSTLTCLTVFTIHLYCFNVFNLSEFINRSGLTTSILSNACAMMYAKIVIKDALHAPIIVVMKH